jgi:hypothetical protein
MGNTIRTFAAVVITLFLFGTFAAAEEAAKPQPQVVKQKAGEVGHAFLTGDYAKVADLTYPKIVEALGGREKMIATTDAEMKKLKAKGISFKSYAAKDPGEFHTEAGHTFTVVPTVVEMTIPGGRAVSKSFLLAISADGGKRWTFVDGSGVRSPEARDKSLPKLPAALKLPPEEEPQVIKDKP